MAAAKEKASKNPKASENTLDPAINAIVNPGMDTNLTTIANQNDFSYILKTAGNRLLLVEFFAEWCGPCQLLSTKLAGLAKAYDGRVLIVKVDVDKFEELTSEFNILAIPTFVIMRNKKKLQQFFSSDMQTLGKNLEKYVGKPIKKDNQK